MKAQMKIQKKLVLVSQKDSKNELKWKPYHVFANKTFSVHCSMKEMHASTLEREIYYMVLI